MLMVSISSRAPALPKQCAFLLVSDLLLGCTEGLESDSHGCLRGILRFLECKRLRGEAILGIVRLSDIHPLRDASVTPGATCTSKSLRP